MIPSTLLNSFPPLAIIGSVRFHRDILKKIWQKKTKNPAFSFRGEVANFPLVKSCRSYPSTGLTGGQDLTLDRGHPAGESPNFSLSRLPQAVLVSCASFKSLKIIFTDILIASLRL